MTRPLQSSNITFCQFISRVPLLKRKNTKPLQNHFDVRPSVCLSRFFISGTRRSIKFKSKPYIQVKSPLKLQNNETSKLTLKIHTFWTLSRRTKFIGYFPLSKNCNFFQIIPCQLQVQGKIWKLYDYCQHDSIHLVPLSKKCGSNHKFYCEFNTLIIIT